MPLVASPWHLRSSTEAKLTHVFLVSHGGDMICVCVCVKYVNGARAYFKLASRCITCPALCPQPRLRPRQRLRDLRAGGILRLWDVAKEKVRQHSRLVGFDLSFSLRVVLPAPRVSHPQVKHEASSDVVDPW